MAGDATDAGLGRAVLLQPGEPVQAVIGAQTASQSPRGADPEYLSSSASTGTGSWPSRPTGSSCSTPGKTSMKTARGVVTELPGSTRLRPGTGMWHRIPAGSETLRVHRRFFKDLDAADSVATPA